MLSYHSLVIPGTQVFILVQTITFLSKLLEICFDEDLYFRVMTSFFSQRFAKYNSIVGGIR